jgi:hypothetical protein
MEERKQCGLLTLVLAAEVDTPTKDRQALEQWHDHISKK